VNPRNIGYYVKNVIAVQPQSSSAAGSYSLLGEKIDRTGYLSGVLHLFSGAATGTPSATAVYAKLTDSADNSTFADAKDAEGNVIEIPVGSAIGASGSIELDFDLTPLRQYVQVAVTVAFTGGSTPTVEVAGTLTLGGAAEEPA
jgi:hypothetical protein